MRPLLPRATASLAVVALTVTDRTCAAVLGLEPRVFRQLLISAKIPHARIGRRVVARADLVLAALDRLAGDDAPADAAPATRPSGGADAVLARIGRQRTA